MNVEFRPSEKGAGCFSDNVLIEVCSIDSKENFNENPD